MGVLLADRMVELRQWLADGTAERIRIEAGVSRYQVACSLGVRETTVFRWERGQRSPTRKLAPGYHRLLQRLAARGRAA
jgi:DNA-binding transcriptional regulator YiaG